MPTAEMPPPNTPEEERFEDENLAGQMPPRINDPIETILTDPNRLGDVYQGNLGDLPPHDGTADAQYVGQSPQNTNNTRTPSQDQAWALSQVRETAALLRDLGQASSIPVESAQSDNTEEHVLQPPNTGVTEATIEVIQLEPAASSNEDGQLRDTTAPAVEGLPSQSAQQSAQPTRIKMAELDWHALEYVGTYDENLDCPICRSPLVEPKITMCFHIFCNKCLKQSLEHGDRCPIDRNLIQSFETVNGPVPWRAAPPIILNQLDNLQVRCPNTRCDHVCSRSVLEHHYDVDCPFTKVACPDPTCLKLVSRRDSEEGNCLHKEVDCVHCGKRVELASLDEHYDTDCNQKEITCEHCLAEVPRHRHGMHVANCMERVIECKYKTSGCEYKAKKKEFGEHERNCLYGMIMRMNRSHRADMDNLESVLQDSQERVQKLELELVSRPQPFAAPPAGMPLSLPSHMHMPMSMAGHQPPLFDYAQPHGEGSILHDGTPGAGAMSTSPPTGTAALRRDVSSDSDDRINRVIAYIDIFDAKVENLERYLGEVDARQVQLLMNELGPLKDQILELRNSMGHMGMYVRWLMESLRQTTKRSVGLGGVSAVGGDDDVSGRAAAPATAAGGPNRRGPAAMPRPVPGSMVGGVNMPPRRMSDRENPPRL